MLLDQRNQTMVDLSKRRGADLDARFTKSLCRNNAQRIGAVPLMGKETVEFRLETALCSPDSRKVTTVRKLRKRPRVKKCGLRYSYSNT
jgi:hypothetical protein